MLRRAIAMLAVGALAACASSNPMKPRPTPSDPLVMLYRQKFLRACETDTSPAHLNYCQCAEDALEARFTIKQLDRLMKDPALHEQLVTIDRGCAKSAGLQLRRS